ncbi:hypothetical protein [Rhizobium sp. PL01]|uniref:hypothetical protein n=1 Tax=Rhizobium sp. PL01 TaxID=3085631 RepID=UPI00298158E5|nr:hypothetical protein [Rhizobium sp. PL01]MDW5315523.1 hypothetical protein [Rhizobium sp. PL01]
MAWTPEQQKALALAQARRRRSDAETAIGGQATGVAQPDGKLRARLFDGTILTFPAGTAPEVISRVAKEQTLAKRDAMNGTAPNSDQPSAAKDMLYSGASGVVRGAAELAMLPVTGKRLIEGGMDYLVDKGEAGIRSAFGMEQRPIGRAAEARANMAKLDPFGTAVNAGQDAARNVMDENLYAPKTTAGEYAETVGEFVAPGGFPTRAARAMPTIGRKIGESLFDVTRNAAVPGIASEAAGQISEGTAFEPAARIAGAVMGNAGVAAARSASMPESVVRRAVGDPDAIDWERAVQLQNNSRGVRLTGPEAITQAQNGATALPNLQRVVEGSADGRARTAPFFSARPGQVHNAVDEVLNLITRQSDNPSLLGPRASQAATDAIGDVEQARTAAVAPTYRAADLDTVPVEGAQGILDDIAAMTAADTTGVLSGPLNDLRNRLIAEPARAGQPATRTPVMRPNGQVTRYTQTPAIDPVPARPANDIENLDRTRKYFRDRMDLPQIGADAITKEQNAAVSGLLTRLDDLMTRSSPNFAAGKQQYVDITRNTVDPVTLGPLGRVAAANDTASAGHAVLPANPLTGSRDETIDAITRLMDQDPATTTGLIRQNLADRFHRAATDTQEGANEFVGAKYHKDIAGNEPRRQTLDAALSALPDQRAATTMPELLDVLQATGRRKPIGSATAFNSALQSELGTGSLLATPFRTGAKTIASLGTNIGNAMTQATQRNNMAQLADLFTDPNSVEMIRSAMTRRPGLAIGETLRRSGAQTGAASSDR